MNTKLTLTIEKEVIERAKKYASERQKSLSGLVENYFKLLTEQEAISKKVEISPRIQKLRGVVKVDDDFDYKRVLNEERLKKHGV